MIATPPDLYEQAVEHSAHCMAFQIRSEAKGWKIGEPAAVIIRGERVPVVVRSFRCMDGLTGDDAALVERVGDRARPWSYVRKLAELVKP